MTDDDRAQLDQAIAFAEAPGGIPKLKAYQDTKGVWTIGLGTNLQELTIDEPTAFKWAREKRRLCEREAERFPWYANLSGRRQRAIVEMIYNMGLTRFSGFTQMIAALERGDYAAAAVEALDSKWAREDVGPSRSHRIADMLSLG